MDIKEIVTKELNGEDVSALTKDFTDDQKKEYTKTYLSIGNELKTKTLSEVSGLRKAKADLESKNTDASTKKFEEFQEKSRKEQITKARNKIISDFALTPEETTKLDAEFLKEDSGNIDSELIYGDFKKAYVKIDPDKFINANRVKNELEKNAAEAMAGAAGGGNSGGGGTEKKFSAQAYEIVKQAHKEGVSLTLEQAEKGLKFGKGWNKTA